MKPAFGKISAVLFISIMVFGVVSFTAAGQEGVARVQQIWTVEDLVYAIGSDLNEFWAGQFVGTQWEYYPPAIFTSYTTTIQTGCGPVEPINAVYCGADHGIYYDSNLLQNILDNVGDYAAAAIIAHEWAHLVQNLIGILGAGFPTVVTELQADCLTGIYTISVDNRGLLDFGDIDEAARVLFEFGDELPLLHPQAHGSPEMRHEAFVSGFTLGFEGCSIEAVANRIDNASGGTGQPAPTPPPVSGGSEAYDFDMNGDCYIDDIEFFGSTDLWLMGSISDVAFFGVMDAWIGQYDVCPFASSSTVNLEIERRSDQIVISAGADASALKIEIFDIAGKQVYEDMTGSYQLVWNMRDNHHQRLANGVYLYRVASYGPDGSVIERRIGKVAVVR